MTTDAWLAIGHHLAVFGIFAVLVGEVSLVRPGMAVAEVRTVATIDRAYGVLAAAVLAIGAGRVLWGGKPTSFYVDNPVFWAKLNLFAVIGVLSVWPTIRFIRWRRAGVTPEERQVRGARRLVALQLVLFLALPVLAALMARGIGH